MEYMEQLLELLGFDKSRLIFIEKEVSWVHRAGCQDTMLKPKAAQNVVVDPKCKVPSNTKHKTVPFRSTRLWEKCPLLVEGREKIGA